MRDHGLGARVATWTRQSAIHSTQHAARPTTTSPTHVGVDLRCCPDTTPAAICSAARAPHSCSVNHFHLTARPTMLFPLHVLPLAIALRTPLPIHRSTPSPLAPASPTSAIRPVPLSTASLSLVARAATTATSTGLDEWKQRGLIQKIITIPLLLISHIRAALSKLASAITSLVTKDKEPDPPAKMSAALEEATIAADAAIKTEKGKEELLKSVKSGSERWSQTKAEGTGAVVRGGGACQCFAASCATAWKSISVRQRN